MNLEINQSISFLNKQALEEAAVKIITECAKKSISAHGEFSIVLAGGSTPKGVYSLLSRQDCDWNFCPLRCNGVLFRKTETFGSALFIVRWNNSVHSDCDATP